MAKVRKSKKSENIVKINKNNFNNETLILKNITSYITNKNRKLEQLKYIIDKYELSQIYNKTSKFKRLVSYGYKNLKFIWYVNKYMNELFRFYSYDTLNLFNSTIYIFLQDIPPTENINSHIFFMKNTENRDRDHNNVKKLLKEYFDKIYGETYNDKELNFYYKLFRLGVITAEDLYIADDKLNAGQGKFKLEGSTIVDVERSIIENNQIVDDIIEKKHAPDIQKLINELKSYKPNREKCINCELYQSPMVVLDTNLTTPGQVDVAFIGLTPGIDEVTKKHIDGTLIDKPLIGNIGKEIRKNINKLPNNINWVILNIICCYTKNEKELKNIDQTINNCLEFLQTILKHFPSKYYVPFGTSALKPFGIEDNITKAAGVVYKGCVIPNVHPSSILRNNSNKEHWDKSWQSLYNLLNIESNKNNNNKIIDNKIKYNIPSDKIIKTVKKDYTFLDVADLDGNTVVEIYLDVDGRKLYRFVENKMPVYLKIKDFQSCTMTTNEIDAIVNISGRNKYNISKILSQKLKELKEGI